MSLRKEMRTVAWVLSISVPGFWLMLGVKQWGIPDQFDEWTFTLKWAGLMFVGIWVVYFVLSWALRAYQGKWMSHPDL